MMLQMRAAFSEFERRMIGERTRLGLLAESLVAITLELRQLSPDGFRYERRLHQGNSNR
jgi:hypothetical protein